MRASAPCCTRAPYPAPAAYSVAIAEIGLFPLAIVLLPDERVPLHIFEPRYKELISECVADEREFGLVLEDDEGRREIGTAAAVVEVLQRYDDGRLDIVIEGRERFRILEETSGRTFRTASIQLLPDDGEPAEEPEIDRALAAFLELAASAEAELEEQPDPARDRLSFWLAARIDFGTDVKQELLERRSERQRIIWLTEMFARAKRAVQWARTARERGATNGRVEPP
jgi:Lon protease-like protein